ncbi:unnamed protein product [Periconia digitata]|uniref:Uncharacterized protein n=1 Tax=Periconia digitata TaxID=1303443 RepID=A0A9W4U9I5_9PLEO|nr:unnamed protein product [Periconia digitata]
MTAGINCQEDTGDLTATNHVVFHSVACGRKGGSSKCCDVRTKARQPQSGWAGPLQQVPPSQAFRCGNDVDRNELLQSSCKLITPGSFFVATVLPEDKLNIICVACLLLRNPRSLSEYCAIDY